MQFMQISFPSQKMWTIICNLRNSFLFSNNEDYRMQFLEFFHFSKNMDYHIHFQEFLSFLQKRGLSYSISASFFPYTKMWSIIFNFRKFIPFSKNVHYHMQFHE